MDFLRKIYRLFQSVIDIKMGLIGALFLGTAVFFINLDYGWPHALTAAIKQGIYTFFFGGFVVKLCFVLVMNIRPEVTAIVVAALVPSLMAITATLIVHSIKGTPEPVTSTIPTMLSAPPSFLGLAFFRRRKAEPRDRAM